MTRTTPSTHFLARWTFVAAFLTLSAMPLAVLGDATPVSARSFLPVENFMVPMSDGIRLNTDVSYPEVGSGPWPVLLYRTPYGIVGDNIGDLAAYGYVCVSQDTRGRFGSEGVDQLFRDDGWGPNHTDGRETVDWILQNSWSNGRIGTLGGSARGITQNMLAGALPDSVRCMSVTVAPANMYEHVAFPGGAFRQYDVEGWLTNQGSAYMIDSLYAHPNDDEWWSWLDTESRHHLETIPTYQSGGWFDLFLQGTIDSFTGLQYGGGEGAAGNQKLLIGPWTHGLGSSQAGELTFPDAGFGTPNALIGSTGEWFDHWMLGVPNAIMEKAPIAYYVMGDVDNPAAPGNEWRTAADWPPASQSVAYYLREGGALSLAAPGGSENPESYDYDPTDPVPTLGGANLILPAGSYDQTSVLWRPDVLVYQTDPLLEPLEITGQVLVNLYASSDRVDTDFTAKLCDVYPDGRVMLICDGILRARHRLTMESEDFLVPGEIYPFAIDLWETAIVFDAGHRILLAISSSNNPRFDANPNTGEPFMQHTTTLIANNTVYHQPAYPSHLILPVTSGAPAGIPEDPEISSGAGVRWLESTPNPFFTDIRIRFGLGAPAAVGLSIFDVSGKRVRRIIGGGMNGDRRLAEGEHILFWDGRDDAGRPVPSGVFYGLLEAGDTSVGRRLILIR